MTNLNDEQQRLLDDISRVKLEVDADLSRLLEQQAEERWEIQEPLRIAARKAAEAGVPARRIGFVLETSDHKTIKRYTSIGVQEVGD